ncbi:GAF domain-containing protein [Burkholderiaceae bacterium UC74_6]
MSFETSGALDMSTPEAKREAYRQLRAQVQSVFEGERNQLANLAQFSALIFGAVPDLNWAGFYMADDGGREELILGPFQGKVACVRIPFSRGVCGASARTREIQLVKDVHAFPGHIACDSASQSELVLPVVVNGRLIGVFDMDSPSLARFDEEDARGMGEALALLAQATDWA